MRGRSRTWWRVAAAVAAVVVVLAVWLSTRGTDVTAEPDPEPSTEEPTESPTPTPTPVEASVPAPTAAPEEVTVETDGTALTLPFVAADAQLRQDPDQPVLLDEVATGTALSDLEAGARELAEDGLTQTGSPEVVSATVTAAEPDADPPTVTVLVCLDYGDVDVVDASGTSIVDPEASRRVATILHLVEQDSRWLVERRTFPDDPAC